MTFKKIALFVPSMQAGGAERVALNLAKGFITRGHHVDLILANAKGPLMDDLPEKLNVINLNRKRIKYSIFLLARILRKNKYDALISFISHANVGAVFASFLSFRTCKLVLTEHSSVRLNLLSRKDIRTKLALIFMKYTFHYADIVLAVSEEMAKEMQEIFGLKNIRHIFNPIDTDRAELTSEPELIPGLFNDDKPVIIGIGRLTPAKNFELLIKSFKMMNESFPSNLLILGEGEERDKLKKLIDGLEISDNVKLPGFVPNPQDYLRRANVFVLSSSWEGWPLVVAESLAAGITVVATDCHSGPAEILENGKYGYLVPVNDEEKMSQAIIHALNKPFDPEILKKRAEDFSIEKVTQNYLDLIFHDRSELQHKN